MVSAQQALDFYLEPTGARLSSFHLAREEARLCTGRNAATGDVINEPRTGSWLGAIGYLLLLDQIGTAVKPTTWPGPQPKGASILKALEWFDPATTPKGRKVIYALRCALAHDFSLFNKPPSSAKRPPDLELQHEFELDQGNAILMQLPSQTWGGDYTKLTGVTKVSLRVLGDRVEVVCETVQQLHRRGQLSIGDDLSSPDELAQRYTFALGSRLSRAST